MQEITCPHCHKSFKIDKAVTDFPLPDSPTRPTISPWLILIETSLRIGFSLISIFKDLMFIISLDLLIIKKIIYWY